MRLSEKEVGFIIAGAALVTAICYYAHFWCVDESGKSQPRHQGEFGTAGLFGAFIIDSLDTGNHYFHPNMCYPGQTQVFTPHRYPQVTGGNITALIHQGMDAMRRKAPQDSDWIERPPGDEMW